MSSLAKPASPRTESLTVRVRTEDRRLIDRAARASSKSRTAFLMDAARKAAEDALLDRTLIQVPEEQFRAFVRQLDAKPAANRKLEKSLRTAAPWDLGAKEKP